MSSLAISNEEINMSNQLTKDLISDAVDGNTLHPSRESAIKTIAAGYGDVLTPVDLGNVALDTNARSSIEPLYVDRGPEAEGMPDIKKNLAGLRIHNPSDSHNPAGTQITVRMDEYKGSNPESKYELLKAYERVAVTEAGTSTFIQNAEHLKEVTWVSTAEIDRLTNTQEAKKAFGEGKLTGNLDHKTSAEQNNLIFNQHDGTIDAAMRNLITKQENKLSAEAFTQYAINPKERSHLLKDHPELENATELYKQGENHLTRNGQLRLNDLDNLDRGALKIAVDKIAKQIAEQGPESFGKISITNSQLKPAEHEVNR